MKKNVASQTVCFQMISTTDGSAVTTGTPTVYVLGDGGSQGAGSGTATHEGVGCWSYVPAQAETNYDHIAFTMVLTGALSQTVNVYTQYPQTGDNYARLGAPAGVSVSADIAAIKTETASILTDTAEIGAAGAGLSAVPWNSAWDEEVQSECADALNAYDPPTKAELDTAVANVSVDEIQATAIADLFNTDSGTTYAAAVAGSAVKEIADNAGGSSLTTGDIADAVWDEALAGHADAGSAGATLAAAGSAGDPWSTALPGAYGAGTAGKILGDNLNAPVGTIDTVVDAIKAVTDNLPDSGALTTISGKIDTIDNFIDTEVAAILEDTGTTLPGLIDDLPTAAEIKTAIEAAGSHLALILEDTGTTLPATLATIDGIVDDILVDTGTTLPGAISTMQGNVTSILEDTGTTLPGTLTTIEGKIDTVDGNVDSILTDTGTTLDGKIDDLLEALVYKLVITEASGDAEIFNASNVSKGTVSTAFTTDGTYTQRLKMVI